MLEETIGQQLEEMKLIIILQVLFWCSHVQECALRRTSPYNPLHKAIRRQGVQGEAMSKIARQAPVGPQVDQNAAAANRFSTASAVAVVITKLQRSSPTPASLHHYCDHILGNCLLIERTGKLCARTIYYEYRSYESYCHMDFINCREGDDIWQVVHMGACFELPKIKEYMHYVYHDDWFLDQYYILEDF